MAGPALLEVKLQTGTRGDLGRPTASPKENKRVKAHPFTPFTPFTRSIRSVISCMVSRALKRWVVTHLRKTAFVIEHDASLLIVSERSH